MPHGREVEKTACPHSSSWKGSVSTSSATSARSRPTSTSRRGDGVAKLWLQPFDFAFSRGFSRGELRRIRELTFEHQAFFVERWNEYFAR